MINQYKEAQYALRVTAAIAVVVNPLIELIDDKIDREKQKGKKGEKKLLKLQKKYGELLEFLFEIQERNIEFSEEQEEALYTTASVIIKEVRSRFPKDEKREEVYIGSLQRMLGKIGVLGDHPAHKMSIRFINKQRGALLANEIINAIIIQ